MRIFQSAKKKIFYGVLAGAAGMLAISCIVGFFGYKAMHNNELALIKKYEKEIKQLELVAGSSEVGYSLRNRVTKGDLITEAMVQKVYLPAGAKAEDSIQLVELESNGQYVWHAKTDLEASTVVTKSMFYEAENITNDIREGEFSFIEIPTNVQQNSYVDIRIQFPNGDDYVVLTKKNVKSLVGVKMQMNVGEGEILTVSSAVVDAYIEGAKIYAVPYVDEHMQAESIMTYPLKDNVRELLESSPNVVNIAKYHLEKQNRARLESYLQIMTNEQLSKVEAGETLQNAKVTADDARRDQEARLNEANQHAEHQQSLIGGGE